MDYAAKGTKIQLVGMDKVDDRDTYKVKLTTEDGNSVHVWINAKTFLGGENRRAAQAPRRRLPPRRSLLSRLPAGKRPCDSVLFWRRGFCL